MDSLVGREHERATLQTALERGAGGRATSVRIEGDPGMGRTSLLDDTRATAEAMGSRVLATRGRATDSELPFSGLLTLLRPIERRLDELAGDLGSEVRAALDLGRRRTDAVGVRLGAFRVLTALCEDGPLVLTVDDAHVLDQATSDVLAFVVGRLDADPITTVFTSDPGGFSSLIPDRVIELRPLVLPDLVGIIQAQMDVNRDVVEHYADLIAGNPLVGIELMRSLRPGQRSGAEPLPLIPRPPNGVVKGFEALLSTLPESARRALVVVAADDTGEVGVIEGALARLGEPVRALEQALDRHLLVIDDHHVRLSHPLMEAVAYHQVAPKSRRAAHRALAAVLDRPDQAVARAWQLAAAADGVDDIAAEALELVAIDVHRRGSPASAARTWQRAAELSSENDHSERRRVSSVECWLSAADPEAAHRVAGSLSRFTATESLDALAAATYWSRGVEACRVALNPLPSTEYKTALELELAGTPSNLEEVPAGSFLEALRRARHAEELRQRGDSVAAFAAVDEADSVWDLAHGQVVRSLLLLDSGRITDVELEVERWMAMIPQGATIVNAFAETMLAQVECATGRHGRALDRLDALQPVIELHGLAEVASHSELIRGRAHLAGARFVEAIHCLERAAQRLPSAMFDMVAALALSGQGQAAAAWAGNHVDQGGPRSALAKRRALAASTVALSEFEEIAGRFDELGLPFEAADTARLGAALAANVGDRGVHRRESTQAAAILARIGIVGGPRFPSSLGEEGRASPLDKLTEAERRVALTVAEGHTNKESAAALFLSVKTVDFHLQNIYRKLLLRSRTELAILLKQVPGGGGDR